MDTDRFERRKSVRVESRNLIYVYGNGISEICQGMGRTINISAHGVLMETHANIEANTDISLSIDFGSGPMDFQGTVVRAIKRKDGMFECGVEFLDLSNQDEIYLQQHVGDANPESSLPTSDLAG